MMAILFIESFIIMIHMEMAMQIHINNATKAIAKKMYYQEIIDEITDSDKCISQIKNILKEQSQEDKYELNDIIRSNVDKGIILTHILRNIDINAFDTKFFLGGVSGINIAESKIENGIIDLVVTYKMKLLFFHYNFAIKQRAFVKDWTGCDISQKTEKVYITKQGEVYHTSKECKYLSFDIKKVFFENIIDLRNNSGGKYKECKYCGNVPISKTTFVYITDHGKSFHTRLECQSLKRNIFCVDITQVEGRRICSSCGQEE